MRFLRHCTYGIKVDGILPQVHSDSARLKVGCVIGSAIFLLAAAFVFAGYFVMPAREDALGTYERAYRGMKESVTIRQDGTYKQKAVYSEGNIYIATGKWTLNYRVIHFAGQLYYTYSELADQGRAEGVINPPFLYSDAYLVLEADHLIWGEEYDSTYVRIKQAGPP